MPVNIIGKNDNTQRLITGMYSFDRAFENHKGDIGFPLGKAAEIFGPTGVGKSTFTFGLAGLIANHLKTNITLGDLEGFDPEFLPTILEKTGFSGDVNYIYSSEDEDILTNILDDLRKAKYGVGILDSVAAIIALGEANGELGDANMGQRAKLMAQFIRGMIKIIRDANHEGKYLKTFFALNHQYPKIGGRGYNTPGGEVKNYLASMRIQLNRRFLKGKYEEFPDKSYIIEGTVTKNRHGYVGRKFYVFSLAGQGIHLGLTAMYDGINLGLVSRKTHIRIGDTSFGYLKNIVEEAHKGNDDFFQPFFEVLQNAKSILPTEENESEETNGTEDN